MYALMLLARLALAQSNEVCVETEIVGPPDMPGQRADAGRPIRYAINRKGPPEPETVDASALANLLPMIEPPGNGEAPIGVGVDATFDPFRPGHVVLRVTASGRELPEEAKLPVHVVFVVETSTTNASATTLDLSTIQDQTSLAPSEPTRLYTPTERIRVVKRALTEWFAEWDRPGTVEIVVWDQQAAILLPPTDVSDRATIEAAIGRIRTGLAPQDPIPGKFALPVAIEIAAKRPAPCEDHRVVVFTDGPQVETPVGDPIDQFAARLLKYSRLSVVILPNGPRRAPEYERLATTGRGVAWYADTTWEVRAALDRAILPPRRVAQAVDLDVAFDRSQVAWADLLGADPTGGPLATREQWTLLYDVMLRPETAANAGKPVATVHWKADQKGWEGEAEGDVVLQREDVTASDGASKDLRAVTGIVAFVELMKWEAAIHDWEWLSSSVEAASSPVHAEISAWYDVAKATWPGTPRWSALPFSEKPR